MTGRKYVSRSFLLLLYRVFLHLSAAAGLADDGEFLYNGFFAGAVLTRYGTARIMPDGLLMLTNGMVEQRGNAFYPVPVRLRRESPSPSPSPSVRSFSTSFVFGIQTTDAQDLGDHGMVLVIVPKSNLSAGLPSSYMGLFNSSGSAGNNHLFAIELDTKQNIDSGDMDNNHVGININDGLAFGDEAKAGYYDDQSGQFRNLTLISGKAMQVWVDYDGDTTQINVTIAPLGMKKPTRPLLSPRHDLSTAIDNESYIGFSSSTGTLGMQHYVLGWSFGVDKPAPAIDVARLPKLPVENTSGSSQSNKTMVIALPLVSVVLLLFIVACVTLVIRRKRYNNVELREDWEVEYGPHRIPYKDLCEATEWFKNKNMLGVGGFGRVYKGVLPKSHLEVAVKKVSHESRQGMKEFIAEVASIGRLRHRNIVQLLGYCRLKDELLLVYDYMPNGSLDRYLYSHDDKLFLSWDQRFTIIKGIASGLLYLHEEWEKIVVHRDIKSSNVLLDNEMNARLGDFGLSKLYNHGSTELQTTIIAGTLGYLAPEITRTGKASPLSDVFSFGVFLLEVTTGRKPVEQSIGGGINMLVDVIFEHFGRDSLLDAVDPRLQGKYNINETNLVLKLGLLCSHPLADLRPSMRQVVQYLDGQSPLPELMPSHTSFSMLSMAQRSLSSMGSISQFSSLSGGR